MKVINLFTNFFMLNKDAIMKIKLNKTSRVLMFLALSLPLGMAWATTTPNNAQEQSEATETIANETAATKKEEVEVIGVVGERSLLYFSNEMQKAEIDFYDAFNALADEKKFTVQCRRTKRPGSNISDKVCHPQFVLDRMAQETQAALETGAPYPKWEDIEFAVREEQAESIAYVEKVVTENPQLMEKLLTLNAKQEMYEQQKNKKRN
jgi:hypothetical protein